jgi:class I fructose-bisphosphate aldolase/fructose-bisphosphate aldolase/2-amino-3,7-dideoxy-D-threo-hept-6-ulosonate synthase
MAFFGKKVRLERLVNTSSGRLLTIAFDHAIGWGVIQGIEKIQQIIDIVGAAEPNAITIQKGLVETCMGKWAGKLPFILKCTSFSPFYSSYDGYTASVEEAIRLGAEAISVGVTIGGKEQPELLKNLALFTERANLYGMPVITHIYPKGEFIAEKERLSYRQVVYAARTAAELGVDIVKTFYTGDPESYRKVIEACPVKVVVSGGPRLDKIEDVFQMARDAIDAGAAGITFGRNVWQRRNASLVIQALKGIINDNISVAAALDIVKE